MLRYAIDHGVNISIPPISFQFVKGGASELFVARAAKDGYRDSSIAAKLPSWLIQSSKSRAIIG